MLSPRLGTGSPVDEFLSEFSQRLKQIAVNSGYGHITLSVRVVKVTPAGRKYALLLEGYPDVRLLMDSDQIHKLIGKLKGMLG
jgi:hypothetical protein